MSSCYCTQSDIEDLFGISNVAKWADLDGDGDAGKISSRIARIIGIAADEIDDRLRNHLYAIPLSGESSTVTTLAASMAALRLASARGNEDSMTDLLKDCRERVDETFRQILSGVITLPCAFWYRRTNVPRAV